MYYLPKDLPVNILGTISSSVFDCSCHGNCNMTEISKQLVRSLFFVSMSFDQPIIVSKAYVCTSHSDSEQEIAHTQGKALQLSSSDNELLYQCWTDLYPEQIVTKDENFVYVRLHG